MTEPLTTSNTILRHKICCKFSGLVVGTVEVITTAGAIPYLSHWDKMVAYHPVFSLSPKRLMDFVSSEWKRLAQRATDMEVTQSESDMLCVSYLALLHQLDCIKQDIPALPPLSIVQQTITGLMNLSYWKWKLESERFRFPTLHISRANTNYDFSNIKDYLDTCFEIRKDYEKNVRESVEREKIEAAEKAIVALNSSWVTPTSKKLLWQWVKANLPAKYHPDAEGWLSTLFLGGSSAIIEFEKEDIELAEEIIQSSCPNGTGVMFAVRQRLEAIRNAWEQHHETYSIELEDYAENSNLYVNGERVKAQHPGPEPKLEDFGYSKPKFFVAHAKWTIAKMAFTKDGGIL